MTQGTKVKVKDLALFLLGQPQQIEVMFVCERTEKGFGIYRYDRMRVEEGILYVFVKEVTSDS